MVITNRYELLYYVMYKYCNPNGDPDLGNMPRMDPQTLVGLTTDGCIKRRVRNYVEVAHEGEPGMNILIREGTNINLRIAEAKRAAGVEKRADKEAQRTAAQKACEMFYDVRAFGAVMSTGPKAGKVTGPVQFTFGRSIDPILPLDISITRMAAALGPDKETAVVEDYEKLENEQKGDEFRTMGRKQLIPFGLYEVRVFISANLAARTGFDEKDLAALFEAILNMYEHDHSSSKGEMAVVSPLIIFKHVGTDSDKTQRPREAMLGCAPAHKLFELVSVTKKDGVEIPRDYRDYNAKICLSKLPRGVQVGFQTDPYGEPVWDYLPEDEEWLHET